MLSLILTYIFITKTIAEECKTTDVVVLKEDVNTAAPKGMEGAVIIVRQLDGTESVVPLSEFKVVPRKKQLVTKLVLEKMTCEEAPNTLMIGLRKDYKGLSVSSTDSSATVISERGAVGDVSFIRRELIGPLGVGAGIDTNGAVKGLVGVDF